MRLIKESESSRYRVQPDEKRYKRQHRATINDRISEFDRANVDECPPRSTALPLLLQERCKFWLTSQTEKLIPLSIHRHRLGALGGATPFFFEFALFCTFCMLSTLFIYSLWACIRYASDNWCKYGEKQNPMCGSAWRYYFSLVNKTEFDISITERGLFFLNILVMFLLRVITFRTSRNLERELDGYHRLQRGAFRCP
jgi:hypothetical protein